MRKKVTLTRTTGNTTAGTSLTQTVLDETIPSAAGAATVTQSLSLKVSESVHWGSGTWDKIPYSVEVHAAVTLRCDQTAADITCAQAVAASLALASAKETLSSTLAEHVMAIKNELYPDLFGGA